MTLFRRRDAWWEMDGKAARNHRRQKKFVSTLAFLIAIAATSMTATLWWMQLGVGAVIHAKFGIL